MKSGKKVLNLLGILKYIFSIALICAISRTSGMVFFIVLLGELILVTCVTAFISHNNRKIGYVIGSFLSYALNIQLITKLFGGTYISYIMLSNLDSIRVLGGRTVEYCIGIVLILIFSLIPFPEYDRLYTKRIFTITVCLLLITSLAVGKNPFAYYSYLDLFRDYAVKKKLESKRETDYDRAFFYSSDIKDEIKSEINWSEQHPNIVLIFTEGLSQSVVEDEREIMPNVLEYEKKSLYFDNYFNHTSATYRGILGTLYSGYQLNNQDKNSLISMQSILRNKGYYTEFINTENYNFTWTNYLNQLGFDNVYDITDVEERVSGCIGDKDAYDILYKRMEELNKTSSPYFLSIYTVGTHVSFDSLDVKFDDGSNRLMNKFYCVDHWFGEFMKMYEEDTLSDNTIIIFTTDHCTCDEQEFQETFSGYERVAYYCDEIPFFIYYKGIEPQVIECFGRNSLCLAPTIMDYLDVSAENYFLGSSLFGSYDMRKPTDCIYTDSVEYLSTSNGEIGELSEMEKKEAIPRIEGYYVIASE